jgi:hypothetical protein
MKPELSYFIAAYLIVLAAIAVTLVYMLWPPAEQLSEEKTKVTIFGRDATIAREQHLFLMVLLMGFIGGAAWAMLHFAFNAAVTGQRGYTGLRDTQVVWYIMRPWTSALIGLIFYGLLRSGLLVETWGQPRSSMSTALRVLPAWSDLRPTKFSTS